jgi:hypothetical protein
MDICCVTQEITPAEPELSSPRNRAGRKVTALFGALSPLLIPKCPLCLAAWTGTLGLGAVPRRLLIHYWWSFPALIAILFLPVMALAIRKRDFSAAGLWWAAGAAVLVEVLSWFPL